jgi:hypothetical protein
MEASDQIRDPATLPQGKNRRYSLDRRLGGPQSRSWQGGEDENS